MLKQDLLKHLGVKPGEKIDADKLPNGRLTLTTRKLRFRSFPKNGIYRRWRKTAPSRIITIVAI